MPKKLIDIYPPKRFDDSAVEESLTPAKVSAGLSSSFKVKKLWFGLPLLLIPFLVVHFFLAEAKITIRPQVTELHITEQIIAQIGQQNVDLGQKFIPAKLFEQEKSATKSFPATGKEEREEKSEGIIRVFNENASTQTLVVNTRFISEDGKLFRSTERVSVPAANNGQPGSLDVRVLAAEAGSTYNIESSNFSLPGLAGTELYTKVYGKSSTSMTGGAIGEVFVVTEDDISEAKKQLLQDLEIDAKGILLSRIPPNFMILESSMETDLLEDNSLVQAGAALEEFTYTASLKVSALAFAKEDGILLARNIFGSYLEDTHILQEDTFNVNYTVEAVNTDTGRMVLNADISAREYASIDLANLKNGFKGASKQDIQSVLIGFPSIATAELSLWPFWLQNVPGDQGRVEVDVSL